MSKAVFIMMLVIFYFTIFNVLFRHACVINVTRLGRFKSVHL